MNIVTTRMNTKFSESDMLRLALIADEDLSLLGNILWSRGKQMEDDKKRFEEQKQKQKKMKQKKIKPINIPNAKIRNLQRKHKSNRSQTQSVQERAENSE